MIKLNNEFDQARIEFKQENYKKALEHFENIGEEEMNYNFALPYKISCLIKLERYREALDVLNPLIEENPNEDLLWFDKVTCHIFLDEDENAFEALGVVETLVDFTNKVKLVLISKLYNMLNDYEKAIYYADKALTIDENYKEALFEKSFAAINLDDCKVIGEISDRLLEISDRDLISLTPVFLLKLFSKDYSGCFDLINGFDDINVKTAELFKSVLYNKMCEDLNARLLLTRKIDLSVDDALRIMFDFNEFEKSFGEVYGVHYFIV